MTVAQLVEELVGEVRRSMYGRCDWCGSPCYGRSCESHKDLNVLIYSTRDGGSDLGVSATVARRESL